MKLRRLLSVIALSLLLGMSSVQADVRPPRGFDKKVYNASYALYATSELAGIQFPRFICTVTVFDKIEKGYLLIGAGHCTPANSELPPDMKFFIESDINELPIPVVLLKATLNDSLDYAIYYLPQQRTSEHKAWNLKVEPIALGNENALHVGSEIVDVNFSLGLSKEVDRGRVVSEVVKSGDMKGFYGVDMFGSHGASGSAIVDEKSKKIVGLLIAGIDGATMPIWVEPISKIEQDLSKTNIEGLIHTPMPPKIEDHQRMGKVTWDAR